MRIQTNLKMRQLLHGKPSSLEDYIAPLPDSLRQFLEDVRVSAWGGLVTLGGRHKSNEESRRDPTGVECLLNKVQMDEFDRRASASLEQITRVGISYALTLKQKIEKTGIPGEFRLIISACRSMTKSIPYTCDVRFHLLRKWNPWLADDIESYEDGAVLTIDWTNQQLPSGAPSIKRVARR